MATLADAPARGRSRFYISVAAKFGLALFAAVSWLMFSIIVSRSWMQSLSEVTHPLFALFAISFIAFVPGFMNAFLVMSLLLNRRPRRHRPASYPGVTVLIAAYQEEAAIADTLQTLAEEDYSGQLEVLVLNDGSTDRTAEVAAEAIDRLTFPATAQVRIVNFVENRGKAAVLNSGLELASHELIVSIDGDSRLNPDALTDLVERLLSAPSNTAAVARAILVRNSRENLITGAQEWDFAGAAIDLPANDRNVVTLFAGVQPFTGDNVRTHLRATYVHVVKPDWGLSAQLRNRYFRSSEPGEFDYYSPRWYAEVLPALQVRRFVGGWQLLGAAGYGAQRDSESKWRSSRYLNARFTSPAFRKDWAPTGGVLYTNTPVSTGFTYRYLQLNLGVTKAF